MLQRSCQQAVRFNHQHRSVQLRQSRLHRLRPANLGPDPADAQASFHPELLGLAECELGIDENQRHDFFDFRVRAVHLQKGNTLGIVGDIDDRKAQILTDLGSGQAHAIRTHHRIEHVGDELDDRVIDLRDRSAALTKDGVTVLDDFANHGEVRRCLANETGKVKHQKPINSSSAGGFGNFLKIFHPILNNLPTAPSKPASLKTNSSMKTIITTVAIAALALVGAAPEADARPYHQSGNVYISGYRSCGTPVYSERYFIGYDRCGEPIWGVRSVRQPYYRPAAQPRYVAPCPPPYRSATRYSHSGYRRPYSGGSVVVQGFFGR